MRETIDTTPDNGHSALHGQLTSSSSHSHSRDVKPIQTNPISFVDAFEFTRSYHVEWHRSVSRSPICPLLIWKGNKVVGNSQQGGSPVYTAFLLLFSRSMRLLPIANPKSSCSANWWFNYLFWRNPSHSSNSLHGRSFSNKHRH